MTIRTAPPGRRSRPPAAHCVQTNDREHPGYDAHRAEVAELADAPDSKSGSLRGVWVRFPPSALLLAKGRGGNTIRAITVRRILYWLAAMIVLLVVGTAVGLIWADTSNVAGAFAGVTNVVSVVGIVLLLIALAVARRRRPS